MKTNFFTDGRKKDYYPFGMGMPGRHDEGQYRYAYQGQEKDPETGMEAFELRLWDARIGRWLTTDPAGQHPSPYLGMGNNPISRIDPDGGEDDTIYKFGDKSVEVHDGVDRIVEVGAEEFEIAKSFAALGELNQENWTQDQFNEYSQFHRDALYGNTFVERLSNIGAYALDEIWEGYWDNTLQNPYYILSIENTPISPGGGGASKGVLKGTKWMAKMLRKPNAITGSETFKILRNGYVKVSVSIRGSNGHTTYVKLINAQGKTVKWFHDTFDKTNKFVHREFNHFSGRLRVWWDGTRETLKF